MRSGSNNAGADLQRPPVQPIPAVTSGRPCSGAIRDLYTELYALYGPRGWWPLIGLTDKTNPGCTSRGYHPLNYELPATPEQIFEICVGAILTQSVSWTAVEKALHSLHALNALRPARLLALADDVLTAAIRPAGYFNQKAKKLRIFSAFLAGLDGRVPARQELLALWGIGPETADSMLLYAFKVPTFVVDAYTRRVLIRRKLISGGESYDEIKALFEENLPRDLALFQEYHALLVEHAKKLRGNPGGERHRLYRRDGLEA